MRKLTPFYVAVPVYDLEEARKFYGESIGLQDEVKHHFNPVDGHDIPGKEDDVYVALYPKAG